MNVNSASLASTQALFQAKTEDLVEGNKPDGDGDQDDRATTSSLNSVTPKAQVTATVGTNINVSA